MKRLAITLFGLAAAGANAPAQAQALRDPMLPPAAARSAPAAAAAPAEPASAPVVRHLLVVGDQRWVVDNGRRRAVGDLLGGARIERIEDAAVFVRQGGTLQRLPLYAGVVKQAPAAPASAAVPAPKPEPRTALAGATGAGRPRP